jgi:Cof subfamily protein (haloacid dehalogenase superfamily)
VFRLVAFDLDNTLVGPNLTLSARVKAAVAQAQAQGVRVTIATGRGPQPTDQYAEALDLTTPLICFQGGMIYDHRARQVLHETRLDPALIPVVVQLAQERGWNLHFELPGVTYLARGANHSQRLLDLLRMAHLEHVDDLAASLPDTPHKFMFSVHDPSHRDALIAEIRAALSTDPRLAGMSVIASHPILVEALPQKLNKAEGLAWLSGHLGIGPGEVMAVGDNDNDVEMLGWAGLGVAMADSSPLALAAADAVVPGASEDGAAVALERYVLHSNSSLRASAL